ncbi:MAG: SurA N-terminal domain-containing protein [Tannerella sp.]|jgi:peptidyl-prolyl cis-trans isomerase D|nr:SurA N-terminal domain-containing protein [Tannerella sp.]
MATLEKIRNRAGLLVVVIGLALFAFIIGDALNYGSSYSRGSQEQVATVDGTPINYHDYQSRIEEMTRVYKMRSNTNTLSDEYNTQIRQGVYSSMVQEIVLGEIYKKSGITVTPEELFDMIQGENVSPMVQQFPYFLNENGVFDKARALNVLKTIENIDAVPVENRSEVESVRDYWLFWERNLKQQKLEEKYTTLLTKAIVANPLEAKNAYDATLENSDIVYALQPYNTISDSLVNVSDSEIKKLYDQRKEQYKQSETRVVDYIAVNILPSQEDYDNASEDIEKTKAELETSADIADILSNSPEVPYIDVFLSEKDLNMYISENGLNADMVPFITSAEVGDIKGPLFRDSRFHVVKLVDKVVAPDSIKVSSIILMDQSGNNDALTTLSDSLLNVLKAGGDIDALADQYSVQPAQTGGGDLGWLTEFSASRMYGEEFEKAAFATALNQPVIVKAPYGVHLIKVTAKTANVPKYKIGYVLSTVTPSSKTYSKLYNELNQYISKNNTSEKIEASAKEAGYELVSNASVASTDRNLGPITDARQVVRWAYEKSTKGEVSDIFECNKNTVFVIAVRKGTVAEGYQSLRSLTPVLRAELATRKKGEQIAANLKAKNLHSVEAYAQAMNSQVDTVRFVNMSTPRITGIGLEPVLNAKIAYTAPNQLSEPVIGQNGVYVFNIFNRTSEAGAYDEQNQIRTLEATNAYRVGYQVVQALVGRANIKDNRIRFD